MPRKYLTYEDLETIDCPLDEQEFTLSFSREDGTAKVFTSDNTMLTKMKKLLRENPAEYKCWESGRNTEGKVTGYFFEFPKGYINFRAKKKQFSEETKELYRERMKNLREKQNKT